MVFRVNTKFYNRGVKRLNFTKTEYLNTVIANILKYSVEYSIKEQIFNLESSFISANKLKYTIKKAKKIFNDYRIVSEEETKIGEIDFRFTICFLKYHKFTFKQIKECIKYGYKRIKKFEKIVLKNVVLKNERRRIK